MRAFARTACLLAVGALALSGCHSDQSIFSAGGPAARSISWLAGFVFVVFGVVAVVMYGLIIVGAVRRRGTLAEHAPHDAGGGLAWILIGGFIIPFIILAVIFVLGLRAMDQFPLHDEDHTGVDIRLVGRQWWWEVQYVGLTSEKRVKTANEIHIPTGRGVNVQLIAGDVIHSFWVPGLHGKVDLIPGHPNTIRLNADKPGTYPGQCAEFCGAEHTLMRLLVVAQPPEEFAKWMANEEAPAATVSGDDAIAGQKLFETRACGLCHAVRGTRALGSVGPDLTHLASRSALAGNSIPNSTAYLAAWITRAQHFKPEAQMPNLTEFTGPELRALTAYLEQLK